MGLRPGSVATLDDQRALGADPGDRARGVGRRHVDGTDPQQRGRLEAHRQRPDDEDRVHPRRRTGLVDEPDPDRHDQQQRRLGQQHQVRPQPSPRPAATLVDPVHDRHTDDEGHDGRRVAQRRRPPPLTHAHPEQHQVAALVGDEHLDDVQEDVGVGEARHRGERHRERQAPGERRRGGGRHGPTLPTGAIGARASGTGDQVIRRSRPRRCWRSRRRAQRRTRPRSAARSGPR